MLVFECFLLLFDDISQLLFLELILNFSIFLEEVFVLQLFLILFELYL